jgi:hypothetical protein
MVIYVLPLMVFIFYFPQIEKNLDCFIESTFRFLLALLKVASAVIKEFLKAASTYIHGLLKSVETL